jgi:hypothetical protein
VEEVSWRLSTATCSARGVVEPATELEGGIREVHKTKDLFGEEVRTERHIRGGESAAVFAVVLVWVLYLGYHKPLVMTQQIWIRPDSL